MKRTRLPDDPPPLVSKANRLTGDPNPGGWPAAAAKIGLCSGMFAFLLNYYTASSKVRLSQGALMGVMVVCALLILAGLGLAIGALIAYRRTRRPGVLGFAIPALLVNVLLAAILIISIVRVL